SLHLIIRAFGHTFLLLRPPRQSPLFPYTTLFRSLGRAGQDRRARRLGRGPAHGRGGQPRARAVRGHPRRRAVRGRAEHHPRPLRSEEHTSELQSRENLVCRLLLEKKKVPLSVIVV